MSGFQGTGEGGVENGAPEVATTVLYTYSAGKVATITTIYLTRKRIDTYTYTGSSLTSIVTTWANHP